MPSKKPAPKKPSQASLAKLETQNLIHEAIMSDTQVIEAPASQFTPKEQALLVAAMSSLKSGPPELDMELFVKFGNFATKKTAQNQWGALKKKLLPRPQEGEEGYKAPSPTTPKKTPAKKRTKKESDDEEPVAEGEEGSAMKKAKTPAKKTPAKKGKKAAAEDDRPTDEANATAAGSPKKKKTPAKPRAKKVAAVKEEETVVEEEVNADVKAEEETAVQSKETSAPPPPPAAADEDVEMDGAAAQ